MLTDSHYVLCSIALVGVLIPDNKLEKEPWDTPINPRDVPMPFKKDNRKADYSYNWEKARSEETEEWLEFMEEIENRGLEPWDPEAQEIWDSEYH